MLNKYSKDDYILRSLSKISHKKWELFIVSRIIHNLEDPEIEFSCQQAIKTKKRDKPYLTDLCFPQLKLYLEVHESYHESEKQKLTDKHRKREILDAINFEEKVIKAYNVKNPYITDPKNPNKKIINPRNLKDIVTEVDQFIDEIKKRKKKLLEAGHFKPWNYENRFNPDPHIERGYIDVSDNVVFRRQRDALELFGYSKEKGNIQRCVWNIRKDGKKVEKTVWFPKLYDNRDWVNVLSDDFNTFTSTHKIEGRLINKGIGKAIIFPHYKNLLVETVYKFIGEFHQPKDNLENTSKHVYKRVKTRLDLNNI